MVNTEGTEQTVCATNTAINIMCVFGKISVRSFVTSAVLENTGSLTSVGLQVGR